MAFSIKYFADSNLQCLTLLDVTTVSIEVERLNQPEEFQGKRHSTSDYNIFIKSQQTNRQLSFNDIRIVRETCLSVTPTWISPFQLYHHERSYFFFETLASKQVAFRTGVEKEESNKRWNYTATEYQRTRLWAAWSDCLKMCIDSSPFPGSIGTQHHGSVLKNWNLLGQGHNPDVRRRHH